MYYFHRWAAGPEGGPGGGWHHHHLRAGAGGGLHHALHEPGGHHPLQETKQKGKQRVGKGLILIGSEYA